MSSATVSSSGPDRARRAVSHSPTEWRRRAPSETFGQMGSLLPKFSVSAQQPALHLARKCREFADIPAETNGGLRKPRCVVAEAVCRELVSAWEFSLICRELSGNFRSKWRFGALSAPPTHGNRCSFLGNSLSN